MKNATNRLAEKKTFRNMQNRDAAMLLSSKGGFFSGSSGRGVQLLRGSLVVYRLETCPSKAKGEIAMIAYSVHSIDNQA